MHTSSSAAVRRPRRAAVSAAALAAALGLTAPAAVAQAAGTPGAAAATATLQGRVTAPDGAPLEGVAVIVRPAAAPGADSAARGAAPPRGAMTDAAGRYAVPDLAPGAYAVTARRVGLAEQVRAVTLGKGAAAADFRLADRAAVIAPVVVSATRERQRRAEASATIDVLDGAEVRLARAAHPAQVMKRVPGVYVSQLSGEGSSVAIRQPITTKPMYLYLEDGIPTRATGFFNHNALYEVNIPQSGGIEVLKGPGTALYGSDAIGGVVNVLSRPAPARPTAEVSTEGGAFGYQRLLATGGGMAGGDGVRADLNLTRVAGWRERNAYERQSGTVRWDHTGDAGLTVRAVVTGTRVDQNDAIAQDSAQFAERSALNRSPLAYRRVTALRASAAVEKTHGPTSWGLTPYVRRNVLSLLPNWQLTFDPQVYRTRSTSVGLLARARRDFGPAVGGRPAARVIAGADVDVTPGAYQADSVRLFRRGTGGATVYDSVQATRRLYDYDVTYRQASPYAQVEVSPVPALPGLRLDAGARYDVMAYAYRTRVRPTQAGRWRVPENTTRDYTRLSPKVGATYEVSPALGVFASYRAGFRAPGQGQLFTQGPTANTVDLKPVRVGSYETGVRGQLGTRLGYTVSAYDMTLRDDILTFTTAAGLREARNAGVTRHRGVETSLGALVARDLRLDVAYSATRQRYVTYAPQAARPAAGAAPATPEISYAGLDIEQAPSRLGNALLTWSPRLLRGGRVAAEYTLTGRYVAGYRLDAQSRPAAPKHYDGYRLWNLHANAQLTPRVELFGRVINAANTAYAEVASFNANDRVQPDSYTPGNPRTAFVGLRLAAQR
jgi:outer membrane receptor protein involved in Fe transport